MRAFSFDAYGPAHEVLKLTDDLPAPEPGDDELLVRVHATSVNNIDCAVRRGYGAEYFKSRGLGNLPIVPGRDVSGVVEGVGPAVKSFGIGDEVYAAVINGGTAEYITVKADHCALKPRSLDHLQAASFPYAALTAWAALVTDAGLSAANTAGQKLAIPAGAGGVGSFAIQLVKAWDGETATMVSSRNIDLVKAIGADHVFDYAVEDFTEHLNNYDVALNTVDGQYEEELLSILKVDNGARFTSVVSPRVHLVDELGLEAGNRRAEEMLTEKQAAQARLGRGYFWCFCKPNGAALAEIAALIDSGKIKPVIDRVYPMAELAAAQEFIETRRAQGKVLIDIAGDS